jgi:hypothetical protein
LYLWAEQNARGKGELSYSVQDLEDLKKNPASKIIILEDADLLFISRIFLKIPWEYSGVGSIVGKKYEAIKDFFKIYNISKKDFLEIVITMGLIWANNIGE